MPADRGQPLNKAQAQRFNQALAFLRAGSRTEALSIADELTRQVPGAADAWQLLGMCLGASGHQQRAERAFEHALALLPGNEMITRNYAACLARHGKGLRATDEPDAAEPVLRRALAMSPEDASAWVDLGVVLRTLGRADEALVAFRRADRILHRSGTDRPGVQNAITGTLADAGRPMEALENARSLVAAHPDHAPAHESLGHLLWEHGAELAPGQDPLGMVRAAALAQPHNRELQLTFARMLLATRRPDEALTLLQALRRREPGDAMLAWFAAEALDALREYDQAAALYAMASGGELAMLPEFLNARARHALRTRELAVAVKSANKAVEIDPRSQEGWSLLGTAWRLAGDQREYWLCDYERLVGYVEIEAPLGFSDVPGFLQSLAARLHAMHNATREPVHQSVRGGTQTAGQLFGRDEDVIRAAEAALRASVERWLATLPEDADHPFLSCKRRSVRFAGSWSVRLRSSGRHSNHIHPKGWASSAFYVALPDSVLDSDSESRAGWIQFGEPLEDLELDLPPRRVIRPLPGYLALFPSYMWHGTVPFEASDSRLTIAFDMLPRA